MIKQPIRYFLNKKVRTTWDNQDNQWWYSAVDVIYAITNSVNPRIYWNSLKKRKPELRDFCKRIKMYADDKKKYLSDTINEKGINQLGFYIANKNVLFKKWLQNNLDTIDERSKKKAHDIFNNNFLNLSLVGKTILLQQIHAYLFENIFDFAGKIRNKNISKNDFVFANAIFLPKTLKKIDKMNDQTFNEIIDKYIEMNIAHPFMEGNGRATRIWLDLLLKKRLSKCIDWNKIEKYDYLLAMKKSPTNPKLIFNLLKKALTDDINNREIFMKGIDNSYFYEKEE